MNKQLEIQGLSKRFPIEGGILRRAVGSVQALDHVSLSLDKGETLGIVGGSGCGKSTLAKLIMGLITPDAGEVLWDGHNMAAFSPLERARRVQMIFQDPYASLNPKLSIGTQLRDVVALTRPAGTLSHGERAYGSVPSPFREKVAEGRMREECIRLLDTVGLPADVLSHYPFQFSGGQRQRIAIARALAMNPELLIADEPLSSLDVTTQAQVLDLFGKLRTSYGLSFLFITHDLAVAYQFASRVIVLKEGRVVEEGITTAVLKNPQNPYTKALLAAVPHIPC
jgi:ABC-type glutathione transport system ATPase component